MKWLLWCGILFALALMLFVVPAALEGPVLIPISPGHGLSLVEVVALVGQGWRLRRRSRIGAAGCIGVRLLLVVGDWSRAAFGDATGGRRRGRREWSLTASLASLEAARNSNTAEGSRCGDLELLIG
jgi:hypothetical protein